MEKVLKSKFICYILIIATFFAVVFCQINLTNGNKKIYADESVPVTTEIANDGKIFTSKLWQALAKFYRENCDETTSGRIHGTTGNEIFYPDLFKDFNTNILDLSSKEIDSIQNLSIMDLSSFTNINLSNNQIEEIGSELAELENLQVLDLSKNSIKEFSYTSLHQSSYSNNLIKLNISENSIESCDISKINQGEIDAKLNYIEIENLVLPENEEVVVNLSHNLLGENEITNQNITLGFQGVRNQGSYIVGKTIYYYSLEDVEEIKIIKLIPVIPAEDDEEQEITYDEVEIETLHENESYTFNYGYYKLKFTDAETTNPLLQTMKFYISPEAPTIKMFVNGEELEKITHNTSVPITIKIYGDENATFYVNNVKLETNEITISKGGIYTLNFYQVFDDIYKSAPYTLYLKYEEPQTASWLYLIGGIGIFVALFYLAIKFTPKLASLNIGKSGNKTDLD